MRFLKGASKALRQGWAWADRVGNSEGHDLSLADEVFAIFAGVTLFVSSTEWLTSQPRIIFVIIAAVSVTVVAIIVAINQTRLPKRLAVYAVAVALGFGGVQWIMEESGHDLFPQLTELRALPVGVVVWIIVREVSILALNILGKRAARQADEMDGPSGHR